MDNKMRNPKRIRSDESESETEFSDKDAPRLPKPKGEPFLPPKHSNAYLRTISTLVLIGIISVVLAMGHFYCTVFILALMGGIFNEIINLKRNYTREKPIEFSTNFNWYFFVVVVMMTLITNFKDVLLDSPNKLMQALFLYRKTLFFSLYMAGFLVFVLSLRKGFYRYQIRLFFWTHIVLGLVFLVSAMVPVIYHGLIWFLASVLLVTSNDVFAYVFGKFFGKRPLISLSPNKTVEGFIGGMVATIFFAWFVS